MKVIKHGKKLTEVTCPVCEAMLAYEGSDVEIEKTPTNSVLTSLPPIPVYDSRRYIICPECNHKIYLDPIAR